MPASPSRSFRSFSVGQQAAAITFGVLLLALIAAGVIWYLAYAADEAPPQQSSVSGLRQPVTLRWSRDGPTRIEAASLADTYAALGYVHGMRRTWSIALWRQTALGRLAEWFGTGVLPIDRHAHRLDLARQSRQAFEHLSDAEQALLESYASGVNAALEADAARHHDELVLLDLMPDLWQPWHTLAIERLFGWLATSPLPDSVSTSFARADAHFRRWLRLDGFDHSIAWARRTGDSTVLFQRHTYGSSALPLVDEVLIDRPNQPLLTAASLPGTPFLPTGTSGPHGWSFLLDSRATISQVDTAALALTPSFHRLQTRSGREELLQIERTTEGGLPLQSDAPDSMATVLRWAGFRPISDAPAWHALLDAESSPFELLAGTGLRIDVDGWTETGSPPVREPLADGVLIGRSRWARYQAEVLRARLRNSAPSEWTDLGRSDSSAWAARQVEALRPALRPLDPAGGPVGDALTYLRNWNFRYDRASIAASVLDTWLHQHGAPFAALESDSLLAPEAYRQSFRRAVDSLVHRFGADAEQWRWERVQPNQRYFPVWSADSLVDQNLSTLAATRYAPIRRPHGGHPSTPTGGASPIQPAPTPASWAGWMSTDPGTPLTTHQLRLRPDAFMSRYTAPDRSPTPVPLRPDRDPDWTTRLIPAEAPQ